MEDNRSIIVKYELGVVVIEAHRADTDTTIAFGLHKGGQQLVNHIVLTVGTDDSLDSIEDVKVAGSFGIERTEVNGTFVTILIDQRVVLVVSSAEGNMLETHKVAEHVMIHLIGTDHLGSDGAVARSRIEAAQDLQLGLSIVECPGTNETGGNHVTVLIGLTTVAIEQGIARIVLHKQIAIVLGKNVDRVLEVQDFINLSSLIFSDVVDTNGSTEDILGNGHLTDITILGRDSLHGSVAAQGERSSVLRGAGGGIATVGGIINLGTARTASDSHLNRVVVGTTCRLDAGSSKTSLADGHRNLGGTHLIGSGSEYNLL